MSTNGSEIGSSTPRHGYPSQTSSSEEFETLPAHAQTPSISSSRRTISQDYSDDGRRDSLYACIIHTKTKVDLDRMVLQRSRECGWNGRSETKRSPKPSGRKLEILTEIDKALYLNPINAAVPLKVRVVPRDMRSDIKLKVTIHFDETKKQIKGGVLLWPTPVIKAGETEIDVEVKLSDELISPTDNRKPSTEYFIRISSYGYKEGSLYCDTNSFQIIEKYLIVVVGDKGVGKSKFVDTYIQAAEKPQELDAKLPHSNSSRPQKQLYGGSSNYSFTSSPSLKKIPIEKEKDKDKDKKDKPKPSSGDDAVLREFECQFNPDKPVMVSLWDTNGSSDYEDQLQQVLTPMTSFVFLCISLADRTSRNNVKHWVQRIHDRAPQAAFAIIGLQKDKREQGLKKNPHSDAYVSTEESENQAKLYQAQFYMECEASELDEHSIVQAFGRAIDFLTSRHRLRILKETRDCRSCSSCVVS